MKQYIILAIALFVILILNTYQSNYLETTSKKLISITDNIYNYIEQNDYSKSDEQIINLEKTWEEVKKRWDMLTEHNDIEELERHIKSLKAFSKAKEFSESINEVYIIKQKINHILENESLSFETIF